MAAHYDKLQALINNPKLPAVDLPKVKEALANYKVWQKALDAAKGKPSEIISSFTKATNIYKNFIEIDLTFDSKDDFLYRQKGQIKIDNTILEEFMPRLVDVRLVPGLSSIINLISGPQQCFAGFFIGPIASPLSDGGVFVNCKNQDFAVGRQLFLKTSTCEKYADNVFESKLNIGHFVSEIKTNLDKTMFQEAAATAQALKSNVINSTYVLLCEWLDMSPIDTRLTPIDSVILLRNAKRLNSNIRSEFSTVEGRKNSRDKFVAYLDMYPLNPKSFELVVELLNKAFPVFTGLDEESVFEKWCF